MADGQNDFKGHEVETSFIPTPEFEKLVELAKRDPKEFEKLRQNLCQQVINEAPLEYQHRLQGMQFTMDMERKRSGNSLSACLKFSSMMHDSLNELKNALDNPRQYLSQQDNAKKQSAKIIEFPKKVESIET